MCRHNEKYWRHVPYLGFGPSAHSFDGATEVVEPPVRQAILRGPQSEGRRRSRAQKRSQPINSGWKECYLGLRTRRGIALEDLPERSAPMVRQLRKAGLVRVVGDRVIPSCQGLPRGRFPARAAYVMLAATGIPS